MDFQIRKVKSVCRKFAYVVTGATVIGASFAGVSSVLDVDQPEDPADAAVDVEKPEDEESLEASSDEGQLESSEMVESIAESVNDTGETERQLYSC